METNTQTPKRHLRLIPAGALSELAIQGPDDLRAAYARLAVRAETFPANVVPVYPLLDQPPEAA